jgi:hypothetical protein
MASLAGSLGQAQVAVSLAVNGYYGDNKNAAGQVLADGTLVKLGYFRTGTSFVSSANVLSTWQGLSGSMSSKLGTFDDNFYTVASTTVRSGGDNGSGWFQILYNPDPEVQPDPAYQALFAINPVVSTPILTGVSLVNFKPFIWVETLDRSEFGLFESILAFPTGTFPDNDLTIDLISGGATALVGGLSNGGLQTVAGSNGSAPTPTISVSGSLLSMSTIYGSPSTARTLSIIGSGLSANIIAAAPTGLQVSSDDITYGTTASFTSISGSASGTLYVRLAANAPVSGSYNSQNIVLSSTGATSVNVATAASGNSVSAKALTISGLIPASKDFDGTITANVGGTPIYVGLANGESFPLTGSVTWSFPDSDVGANKTLIRSGSYSAPSGNYTVSQPTLTASIRAVPTLRLLTLGEPVFSGGNTTVTHTFAVNANGSYVVEYKGSLADDWKNVSVNVSNNSNFSVTFINAGVNTSSDWKNQMFFRAKNS